VMISRRKYLATILGERERLVFGVTTVKSSSPWNLTVELF
jgi:hypothetical protein